jgi:hypothetical protein
MLSSRPRSTSDNDLLKSYWRKKRVIKGKVMMAGVLKHPRTGFPQKARFLPYKIRPGIKNARLYTTPVAQHSVLDK